MQHAKDALHKHVLHSHYCAINRTCTDSTKEIINPGQQSHWFHKTFAPQKDIYSTKTKARRIFNNVKATNQEILTVSLCYKVNQLHQIRLEESGVRTFTARSDEPVAVVADAAADGRITTLLTWHSATLVITQVKDTRLRHLYRTSFDNPLTNTIWQSQHKNCGSLRILYWLYIAQYFSWLVNL